MKRIGVFCLTLCLLLGLCACGNQAEQKPEKTPLEPYVEQEEDPTADTVRVMLREGLTVPEMAAVLEENGVCLATDFITAVQTVDYPYDFLKDLPDDGRAYRLEGYLFPDTYEFYVESNASSVVNKLLANFQRRTQELLSQIEEMGWSMDEAVIFASMIQGEADTTANMAKVSRVLHNRLDPGSGFTKLELCSTRDYVNHLPEDAGFDLEALKQVYNTYYRQGLPIGAINNPGLDALTAALNPSTDSTIMQCYYFATNYQTGITYFSKTYAEHVQVIRDYGITDIG